MMQIRRTASDPRATHIDRFDRAVVAHHDGRENRLPDGFGAPGCLFDGGGGGEVNDDQISLHPFGDVGDFLFGAQRAGRNQNRLAMRGGRA